MFKQIIGESNWPSYKKLFKALCWLAVLWMNMTYTDLDVWQENIILTVYRFRYFLSSIILTETTNIVFQITKIYLLLHLKHKILHPFKPRLFSHT